MRAAPGVKLHDRFLLVDVVGEGGFATVYRARDGAHNGRTVAIKVLNDAYLANAEIVERFRREVFAVASISSPHVVELYDFGISGEEVYIAMEYAEGPSLRDLIYDRSWKADEIHLIIGQIAQALAAAHRQDIVHRDLKPENVVLVPGSSGARHVKVLDFGLAKLAELERKLELEPLTRSGMCFGTPQYMAPELIQGRKFDKAIDLYALGVVTYEMIAARMPWDGADAREVLLSVLKTPAPRLERAHPSVMPRLAELNRFLDRALAKDPVHRPTDAAAFFRELEQALFADPARRPLAPRPRDPAQLPKLSPEEAIFASVVAASLPIEVKAREEDDTLVDMPTEKAAGANKPRDDNTDGGRKGRKLRSSWMVSLVEIQTIGIDSQPVSLKEVKRADRSRAYEASESTEVISKPRGLRVPWLWILPLLVAMVFLAVAVGYFVGRQSR